MRNKREVLIAFKFRKKGYYKGGYIIEDNFTPTELDVLTRMGNIKDGQPKTKRVVPKKKKS